MENHKSIGTPMALGTKIHTDSSGKSVDVRTYRGMIGSLMYLTSSRPDIMFSTCLCSRYQADPKESYLAAVKRIFRYLKGNADLGLWYPKDTGFQLTAYSDADHAGCMLDRKSTSGHVQFLGDKLVSWASKKQLCVSTSTVEAEYVAAASCCSQVSWMRTQCYILILSGFEKIWINTLFELAKNQRFKSEWSKTFFDESFDDVDAQFIKKGEKSTNQEMYCGDDALTEDVVSALSRVLGEVSSKGKLVRL
ncbi:hypothetical protein L6452_09489 [Arctium lappa]|uniref:Uncharacterized protein n=1 Tax=Arctium lappa TaxID=4217 RepID=A0ACB9DKM9_ARCLA|nr:hypothetical protein L6452_09489 [Arctium lappa]